MTDDLEIGALLLPLQTTVGEGARETWFGDMLLYGMYRLTRGNVEVGARVELSLPTNTEFDDRFVTMMLGLPVLIRAGQAVRIDTGVQFAMHLHPELGGGMSGFPGQPPTSYPLPTRSTSGVPVVVTVNVAEHLYLGARSGLAIYDLEHAADTTTIPLGLHVGGTVASSRSLVTDLTVRFEWPFFAMPASSGTSVTTEIWQMTFAASFHIDTL